jgi:hypothetical protein
MESRMSDLPLPAQIDLWRQQVLAGTITDSELKLAVAALRDHRMNAQVNAAKRKAPSTSKAPVRSADQLLDALGGLDA